MSMEQAILEHAGALRELAAAIKSMGDGGLMTREQAEAEKNPDVYGTRVETLADTVEIAKDKIAKQRAERDADQQAAGVCPEATGQGLVAAPVGSKQAALDKAAAEEVNVKSTGKGAERIQAEVTPAAVKPDAELEAAVTKVEEDSKALDYKTDVRPVLLALAKKAGQPALKDLLTKYGAATGDKLTPDQFAGIVADANALIAG